ncbi:MAG: hypothetical protein AB7O74_13160 [Candidatus Nanopelagicales bacterium]
MSRLPAWLVAVRDVADTQMGLITAAQLAELGVSSSAASRKCAGGVWTRVLPGVHLVSGGHPSRPQREAAALLYCGPDSLLTGTSALRHHGFRALRLQDASDEDPDRPEPVHTLIPAVRQRSSKGFVRAERTVRWPVPSVRRHGLPIAAVPRAVGDAVRRLRTRGDVAAILSEAVQRELATVAELREELDLGPMRGSGLFRDVLTAIEGGARSGPEADLVELFAQAGIPAYFNARVVDARGQLVGVPDAWLEEGVAVEVDSVEYHSGPGYLATIRRNARYAAVGVLLVPVLPVDLEAAPNRVLAEVLSAREVARSRPRPQVRVAGSEGRSAGRRAWRWGG